MQSSLTEYSETKRIEYIDALRGFTMLLVVMAHVCHYSFHTESAMLGFFSVFRMPLFFTISGFVLYKPQMAFNGTDTWAFIKKKFRIQIIPTFIFFVLFEWLCRHDFIGGIFSGAKHGYWFTLALFYYFVIYAIIKHLCFRVKSTNVAENAILITTGIILYVLPKFLHVFFRFDSATEDPFSISELCYFIFFALGVLIRKHYRTFTTFLNNPIFLTTIICVTILGYFVYAKYHFPEAVKFIFFFILRTSGIIMAIAFFFRHEGSFSSTTRLGRVFQFIGKRTLDIYLLHYFFLPRGMQTLISSLNINSMPVIYFLIVFLTAALVMAFCLATSSLLRTSPALARWLFGAKK